MGRQETLRLYSLTKSLDWLLSANKRPSHYNNYISSVLFLDNKYAKTIAKITWSKFVTRLNRLYEQKKASLDCDVVLGEYVRRWFRWTRAGLQKNHNVMHKYRPTTNPVKSSTRPTSPFIFPLID
jgi:hypothetical protein